MRGEPTPTRVRQEEIEDATAYVMRMGLKEALRRLEDVEPELWTEVVRSAVAATEPLRPMGHLDDIGGSIREDLLLALVIAAESVRLSHYRRSPSAGGAEGDSPPGLPLDLAAPATKSVHAPPRKPAHSSGADAVEGTT